MGDPGTEPVVFVRSARGPWALVFLLLIAAGFAGWYGWGLLDQSHRSADNAIATRDEALVRVDLAESKAKKLELELAEAAAARDEVASKAAALEKNLQQTEAELAKLKATTDSLREKLESEISQGDIKLSQSGDRIQVDLIDKVLFDSGESALSPRGQEVLGKVAAVLKTVEDKQVQVSGHTDDAPITKEEIKKLYSSNWELSVARAVNVVRYLSEVGGVPPKNLLAAGYSQYKPVTANSTPKGRAANRRIEILLTPVVVAAPKAK